MPDTGHKKEQLQGLVTELQSEKTRCHIDQAEFFNLAQGGRQAEEQFNRLINQLPVGFFRSTPDGRVISVNRALRRMAGYESEEEILAIPAFDFYLNPDHRQQLIRQLDGEREVKDLEIQFKRKKGEPLWVLLNVFKVLDGNGNFVYLEGTAQDITARKMMEEALKASEARYAAIAAQIPGVVFQFLRRRDGSYAIPYVSQKTRDIIGLEPDPVMADVSSIFDLVPAEDLEHVYPAIEESARTMTDYRVDHRIVRPDGTTVWLRVQGTPHSTPDGEVVWNAVAIDVTDSKAADDRLRMAHTELEQRVRERTADLNRLTSALEVLLEHREAEKRELETRAVENYNLLVKPYVDRLRNSYLDAEQEELIGLLEKNFNQVFAPLKRKLSSELAALTPTEIQVAHLIRDGKTTKEMGKLLNVSLATVSFHRHNIRAKFGLVGHKQNLRTYLENIIWR